MLYSYLQTNVEDMFELYIHSCPDGQILTESHGGSSGYSCVCNINNSNIIVCDGRLVSFKVCNSRSPSILPTACSGLLLTTNAPTISLTLGEALGDHGPQPTGPTFRLSLPLRLLPVCHFLHCWRGYVCLYLRQRLSQQPVFVP